MILLGVIIAWNAHNVYLFMALTIDSEYEQIFAMLNGMEKIAKSFCNAS